jgi:hypothetical protein
MFETPFIAVAIFACIIITLGVIIFFLVRPKKTNEQKEKDLSIAELIYEKAKIVAKDVIDYVEQTSKNSDPPLTNEQKKELAVVKLQNILRELYGWEVNEVILDLAIEAAIWGSNFIRDLFTKKKEEE